jgi:peptide/nickel transport system ATP-binding protein
MNNDVVLAVSDLTIAFGERTVVDGLTFELRRGRVLALVGESGSGKSVSAMSILGLLPDTATVSGSILLSGADPRMANSEASKDELVGASTDTLRGVRGGRIGVVFQEPMNAFNPVYRVGWQIAEAIRHRAGGSNDKVQARVSELLGSAGLPDPARISRAFPHELSGGQLQRAMIALALSGDPIAVIADEPTTALDVTVQAGILDLLRELCAERQVAVLLITHDMGVVADLADDVVVMRAGEFIESGEVQRIFDSPAAQYTRDLLDAVPELDARSAWTKIGSPRPADTMPARPEVQLRDVHIVYTARGFRRNRVAAVDGVTLSLDAGRVLGLVGESGSGKSTIGRALAGLVPISSGTVDVGGVDIAGARGPALREVRRTVGYVFQDPASSLNPRATVAWSIAEPLSLHSTADSSARRTRARELLDAVQLPAEYLERFPHELSGGQRQRVAIARALALSPTLLIADEPTSALDVTVQATVLELLHSLQRELGFACLLISHDLAVVRQLADEVAVLNHGRLVEHGATETVLGSPSDPYTRLLLASAPVADPRRQAGRRLAWRQLAATSAERGER